MKPLHLHNDKAYNSVTLDWLWVTKQAPVALPSRDHSASDSPLRAEELEQVGVGAEVLAHGVGHLVVVHLLWELQSEARVIGYGFITESNLNTVMQVSANKQTFLEDRAFIIQE